MKITLGTTYYENPDYLCRFLEIHYHNVDELIIVDDFSVKYPIEQHIDFEKYKNIKIYKVCKDYRFNSHGCRNLIVNQSTNDWVCLIDVDREFGDSGKDLLKIYNNILDEMILYKFRAHHEKSVHRSVNDFLIHKKLFYSVGGYDEEIMGYRSGDRHFMYQLSNFGLTRTLDIDIILTRRPSIDEPSRYIVYDDILNILERRVMKPEPLKPTLTFEWKRVH